MELSNLHNWVFNYNAYKMEWAAVERDHYPLLFSNRTSPLVLRSSRFETLVEIVTKTNGDRKKINKLIGEVY